MPLRPVIAGRVAVLPIAIPIIDARLNAAIGAGQVQLANQPAVVSSLGQLPRDQRRVVGKTVEAIAVDMHGAGVLLAGKKTRTARRADRAKERLSAIAIAMTNADLSHQA